MKYVVCVGIVLIAAALASWLALERSYRIAFARKDRSPDINDLGKPWTMYLDAIESGVRWFDANVTEHVTIEARDGLTLHASLIAHPDARATLILCHGYRSRGSLNFASALPFYYGLGLDLLVVDQRACGDSEGDTVTFGLEERYDLRRWIDWVNARHGDRPVLLGGVSMGAATVLMALDTDLPENVKGIIGDCGYSSAWAQMAYIIRRDYHLPPFPVLYLLNAMFRHRTGHDLREADTVRLLAENTRIPVLLLHGGADRFVPTDFSRNNFAACAAPKDLLIVESATHATAFLAAPAACQSRVTAFVSQALDGADAE